MALLAFAAFVAAPLPAAAHRPSDAYLSLAVEGAGVEGRWDIALRDLEQAIGLDRDRDGAVTWGELKARHAEIAAYALARLSIASDAGPCAAHATDHLVARHGDAGYAVLRFAADCPAPIERLEIGYDLFFEFDALHRGLAKVAFDGATRSSVFAPERRAWHVSRDRVGAWRQAWTYLAEGVWHIWIGLDHILFLVCLLLPAARRFEAGAWRPLGSLREAAVEVVKVVTAFTLAHSVTLCAASLGWLALPSRIVEPVIAASIVAAALNNVFPVVTRRLWALAFGFGLIHGLGFAGALQELGLPAEALIVSLLGFNLGVELGQLAIVALALPPIFAARHARLYPRLVLHGGSLAIAALGALWLLERGFGVAFAL